jgi:tetratricopeptide (TPR) repeat protein
MLTSADALLADRLAAQESQPVTETSPDAKLFPGLTGYTRKITTNSAEAQRWFDQGIQLLYGFNHDEAIRSFEQAAKIDPSCAMAWWGSAYAHGLHINNPQMSEEQTRLADEAARKAEAALDDELPIERGLVLAVRQRYQWPALEDRSPLDKKYADAMESLWHQFPDDPDAAALFAESLMNLQPWDLWTATGAPKGRALEVVAVLERTLVKSPDHPGANHFYIHAIEASPWPVRRQPSVAAGYPLVQDSPLEAVDRPVAHPGSAAAR